MELLASETGMGIRQVNRALSQLKKAGVLTWKRGRRGLANEYTFPGLGTVEAVSDNASQHVSQDTSQHVSRDTPNMPPKTHSTCLPGPDIVSPESYQPVITCKEPVTNPAGGSGFSSFWEAYPRSSKYIFPEGPAADAFRGLSEAEQQDATAAARRYGIRVKPDWVKNPEKWLRNEEWKTEPLTAKPSFAPPQELPIGYFIESYKKTGRWSPQSGCSDISQVDPKVLRDHGLLPDGRPLPADYAEKIVAGCEKLLAARGAQ
jgi:hypothetical protein